jgi:chromosome segregation ATPase
MNKFLGYAFIIAIGLFFFNQENPEKFQKFITQPAMNLKAVISNFSYTDKKEQFEIEKQKIIDQYLNITEKYRGPINALEKEKDEYSMILDPDLTIREKIDKIDEKIREKKAEYLQKKAEIEKQINDLENRYKEIKASIQNFQESIQKIHEGLQQGQDSINGFSNALNPDK